MIVRSPPIQRMARKQPPAASSEPGLHADEAVVSEQCVGVAHAARDGRVALGVATMLANTGKAHGPINKTHLVGGRR